MKRVMRLLVGAVAVGAIAVGCGTGRRDAPLTGKSQQLDPRDAQNDAQQDEKLARGKRVFDHNCYQCHPGGDSGLAPAINNKPAPKALIKTQVRAGLGAMPSFSEKQIPDEELEDIATYLKYLRAQKARG